MAFQLCGRVVALQLDNSIAKAYLCNQGDAVYFFLSRPAFCILNLANKCGITIIPAYIPTHLYVEASYLSWGMLVPERHLLPHNCPSSFPTLESTGVGSFGFLMYQSISALVDSRKTIAFRSFGCECIQPSMEVSDKLCVSSTCINSSSVVPYLVEHGTSQFRLLILVASYWMETTWLPTILSMLEDIPHQCPIVKDLVTSVLVSLVLKGLPLLHISLWLLSVVSCTDKGSLP